MAIQPETLDCQIKRDLQARFPVTPLQHQAARERLLRAAAAQIGAPVPLTRQERFSQWLGHLLMTVSRWNEAQDTWERALHLSLSGGQQRDRMRYVMSGRYMSIPAIV
jgi:hypothetical protein